MSYRYSPFGYDGCSCIECEPDQEETARCIMCYKEKPLSELEVDNQETGEMICEFCIEILKKQIKTNKNETY